MQIVLQPTTNPLHPSFLHSFNLELPKMAKTNHAQTNSNQFASVMGLPDVELLKLI